MVRNEDWRYFQRMRRLPVFFAVVAALTVPVVALAGTGGAGDGSLVVKNGQAPLDSNPPTPVVSLRITGSVIGHVALHGKVVIDAGLNVDPTNAPQVTGASCAPSSSVPTAQVCVGNDFSFRAVGGKFTILVYGTQVNVVAVGTGKVKLAGMPDTPSGDGKYSLNGNDFASLPGAQTDWLTVASNG